MFNSLFELVPAAPPLPLLLLLPVVLLALLAAARSDRNLLQRLGITRYQTPHPAAAGSSSSIKEKQEKAASAGSGVLHDFPPSRGDALTSLRPFRHDRDANPQNAAATTADNCVPLDIPSDDVPGHMKTPTGLSMAEVRALGRFPDYAALSGVPLPAPKLDFDPNVTKPRPYRPLRWPYHQTMALSKMEPDYWLELESTYVERMKQRKALLQQHGDTIMQYSDGSELACREAMELAFTFLVARYPQYFSFSDDKTIFHNNILDIHTQLEPLTKHPLRVLYEHVPEDFVLMRRCHKTGHYILHAGFIVSSVGWTLGEKFGKPLYEIHGPVPYYAEKMSASMNRFFARMPTDRPIQRGSWDICPGQMLFAEPDDPVVEARFAGQADPPRCIDDLHLRVDWQTLRRLPLSGAICFTFKPHFTAIPQLRHEPYIPALLGNIVGEVKSQINTYKMHPHTELISQRNGSVRPLADVLKEWAKEQEAEELTEPNWEVGTLDEHPFFPHWNE